MPLRCIKSDNNHFEIGDICRYDQKYFYSDLTVHNQKRGNGFIHIWDCIHVGGDVYKVVDREIYFKLDA